MKRWRGVFELTVPEQRVVIIVLVVVVAFVALKTYSAARREAPAVEVQSSPIPGIRP
ncbi:MAG: hypothetical protein ACR2NX_02865 [Chthoniobacterales bacterium]